MLPNAGIDIVPPDSLWIGSEKMAWEIIPTDTGTAFPVWPFLCAALAVIFIFICKSPSPVSAFISSVTHPLRQSRTLSFPIALYFILAAVAASILTSGFLCHLTILPVSFFRLCTVTFLATLAVRTLLMAIIAHVSGQACFLSFIRAFLILLTVICLITLTLSVTIWIFPDAAGTDVTLHTLIVLISMTVLVYLYKISITLFAAGISPFYSFLYLCTLEILPVCIMTSLISRL